MKFGQISFSRWVPLSAAAALALAAPAFADLPVSGTQSGTISHISNNRTQFELKLGNGISHHVHYGKAQVTNDVAPGSADLRDGEKVKVFYNGVDPNDRGLDATRIEVVGNSNNGAGGAYNESGQSYNGPQAGYSGSSSYGQYGRSGHYRHHYHRNQGYYSNSARYRHRYNRYANNGRNNDENGEYSGASSYNSQSGNMGRSRHYGRMSRHHHRQAGYYGSRGNRGRHHGRLAQTGGSPEMLSLFGGLLAGGMTVLRRRFLA